MENRVLFMWKASEKNGQNSIGKKWYKIDVSGRGPKDIKLPLLLYM